MGNTEFEAIYYSGPAPCDMQTLAVLGLVFDRLIFPGVYIPTDGVDLIETQKEFERIANLGHTDTDTRHLLNLMACTVNAAYLKDFCVFTGNPYSTGASEEGIAKLTYELYVRIFEQPEGFIPSISTGFSKEIPGDDRPCITSPSWISYPANALLYAGRTETLVVNDNPALPVPSVGGADLKANAKNLATILALESVRFALPSLRPLSIKELAEFRAEVKDLVQPFRRAMVRLSQDLNLAILSDSKLADVQNEAAFLVETTVAPALEEMKLALEKPTTTWYSRAVDVAKAVPEMVGAFATMPTSLALATGLAKASGILADIRDSELEKEGIGKRGGFHYLLKLEQLAD